MLQQILRDMFVDPEILAELDDEQKQTLFCKMRGEQIRRWKEREEELETKVNEAPKQSKHRVSFLKGADEEPWTWVMGDHAADKTIEEMLEIEAKKKANSLAEEETQSQSVSKPIEPAPVCEPVADTVDTNVLRDVTKPVTTNARTEKSENQPSEGLEEKAKPNSEEIEKLKEKRSSEIYRGFQLARQKSVEEANKEGKSIVQAWLEQEKKARKADEDKRLLAKKAREDHVRAMRKLKTESQIIGGFVMSLNNARNKPVPGGKGGPKGKPPRPSCADDVEQWYKEEQLQKGAGIDPTTKENAPYFHGMIGRTDAEERLSDQPAGSFLIRLSDKIWGYALSFKGDDEKVKHYLIDVSDTGYQFFGSNQITHRSLTDFINYYKSRPLSLLSPEKLQHPCPPPRPIQAANHVQPRHPKATNHHSETPGIKKLNTETEISRL